MTISLKHGTLAVGTYDDDGELGTAEWNEEHTLTMSADYILGRATSGDGAVEEIPCTAAGRSLISGANAAAQRTTLGLGTSATYNIGTSGAVVPLTNGDNVWTGAMRIGDGTGDAYMRINGAAGYDRGFYVRSNNVNRWFMGANSTAESGANAGSDFSIWRNDDAGTYIDTPFRITRSNGRTTLKELSLTTVLSVSNGGTGASDAATARTNLGLAIGTDVQAYDADLSAIAALAGTSGILTKTAANTWALDTSTYLTTGSAASTYLTIASAASTYLTPASADASYQPLDTDLSAIAALTSAANKMPYATGAGTWALTDLTAAGRALLDDADAAAQRTTLGVGTGDSPQFTAVNVGAATDTTLSRLAAGTLGIEGKAIPYVHAQSAVSATIGAVTTETVLATITIPGGALGPNGFIELWTWTTVTSNANNKTQYVRLGGAAGTAVVDATVTTNSAVSRFTIIGNRNSQSSQVAMAPSGNNSGGTGQFGAAYPTAAVDTSASWDLVIAGKKANSADTYTLEAYKLVIHYGA